MNALADAELEQQVAEMMHARPVGFRPASGGYTAAKRGVVSFENANRRF